MDPSPENNRAARYQGPMKLEVVKSCVVSERDKRGEEKKFAAQNVEQPRLAKKFLVSH